MAKPLLIAAVVSLTWYDGPGPNTACGRPFDVDALSIAAPLGSGFACGDRLVLCHRDRCAVVLVDDRIPEQSSARYGDRVLDATPAVMAALGIPFGRTVDGLAYGRARVTVRHFGADFLAKPRIPESVPQNRTFGAETPELAGAGMPQKGVYPL